MFTGLVEGLATVTAIEPEEAGLRLRIEPPADLEDDTRIGDSVALNGCCLTRVPGAGADGLWNFQAGPETLQRTNLGRLRTGDRVNFERALRLGDRLGGHYVQGHVDGVGTVAAIDASGEWVDMVFQAPADLLRQMVPKGSITVDGVSLTVVTVTPEKFSVALIPHTLEVTTLGILKFGDLVNLETDIIGKYVEKLVAPYQSGNS